MVKARVVALSILAALFFVPGTVHAQTREEVNESIARRFFENVVNTYDFTRAERYTSQWVVQHNPPQGGEVSGLDRLEHSYELLKTAFPDYQFKVYETIADGNKVAVRYRFTGTHQGPFLGAKPTGQQVSTWGVEYFRVEGNKIREIWGSPVNATLLAELDVIKPLTQ